MSQGYADWMQKLITALSRLPGIGRKSAERIVFYLLKADQTETENLAGLLRQIREKTFFCELCHNLADRKRCHICTDPARDQGLICVVEDPKDVIAFEKTGTYFGTYHVLLGSLSALDGIGPDELQVRDLIERVRRGGVREVILATNPNTEGETTALYLARALKPFQVRMSRIAHGIAVGSMVEYTDQATLSRALEGRVPA